MQLLRWTPVTWADQYHGVWLNSLNLLVTVTAVPAVVPGASAPSAVGNLSVAVLPSGLLTSLDGTSAPSNSSTVVTAGSWGDAVCDSGVVVYSHTALVVAFEPPPNTPHVPSGYTVHVSTAQTFPTNASTFTVAVAPGGSLSATVGLPLPWQPTALRFLVPGLVPNTPYFVRVAADPPTLPLGVVTILPRAVPLVFGTIGQPGSGCVCAGVLAGVPCGAVASHSAAAFTPQRPSICKFVQHGAGWGSWPLRNSPPRPLLSRATCCDHGKRGRVCLSGPAAWFCAPCSLCAAPSRQPPPLEAPPSPPSAPLVALPPHEARSPLAPASSVPRRIEGPKHLWAVAVVPGHDAPSL